MTNPQLKLLVQNAQSICEQLERGQAETPLVDAVSQLQREIQEPVLTVALLGLTPDSLERVLAWLYGEAFKGFAVDSKQWPGFMEVTFTDSGYAFGLSKKEKQQFEQQQTFVEALQIEMGATRATVGNPFAMQAPSSRNLKALKLLIPDTASSLLDSPALLNALIAQTNTAMVVAPLRYTLSREDHEAIDTLLGNMAAFMPLMTVDELNEDAALPEIGWWEQHRGAAQQFEPVLITTHLEASLPPLLTDPDNGDRKSLIEQFQANRLSNTLDAIFERYQQQAGVLEQRKARLASGRGSSAQVDRGELDKLRQYLDDRIAALRKEMDTGIQQLSLQQSPLMKAANNAIDAIEFSNLTTEESHSIIKLTLDDMTLAGLRQTLLSEAKGQIKRYHQQAEDNLRAIHGGINERLQALAVPTLPSFGVGDRRELYDALDQRLEVTLNYRGEMPKRTFWTRLGESRKLIMGISMATMVLGGIAKAGWGIDLRQSIMLFAPIILIGGFIYTFIQWPKEDAEKLEKELDRVRDSLKNELRRIASDIQRFVQQQLFEVLDKQKRELAKAIQTTVQQFQDDQQKAADEERQKQQHSLQQIDQELRQWKGIERQLERLRVDVQGVIRGL